jgi:hypothetical protein
MEAGREVWTEHTFLAVSDKAVHYLHVQLALSIDPIFMSKCKPTSISVKA